MMTPNTKSDPSELTAKFDLNDLANNNKVKVEIVSAEDPEEKRARIKREGEDAKMKRWLTLLLVSSTIALCAWTVLTGQSSGESLLKLLVPATIGYIFGRYT
jgi:hypothetical protein